jgi:3-carboxy-cis,cis-muconate cycloisomerase
MAGAMGDIAWVGAILRFEAALATTQAHLGIVPPEAGAAISDACRPSLFDIDGIARAAVASASPVVPLVAALRELVGPGFAPFVHFGATSQDAIDTSMMLVAREGLDLLLGDATSLGRECLLLAGRYRATPMAARTLMKVALPTTFGCKAAMWLQGVMEARGRLSAFRRDRLAVQLGGPVGTLGPQDVVAGLARELSLAAPDLPWHSARGRVVELAGALVQVAGAAAKISGDAILLAQDEVGEIVFEEAGVSSAMPHKRNPARAIEARAAFAAACAQAGVLNASMAGEHERAAGAWQAEWPAVSELFGVAGGAVARTLEAVVDMRPQTDRMRSNLERFVPQPHDEHLRAAATMAGRAIDLFAKELGDE